MALINWAEQGPTSSEYSCAFWPHGREKRSGNVMLCVQIDVSCFFPAECVCVSPSVHLSVCADLFDDL